ncbi:MAG: hypothetical protein GYB65_21670 [Chloroflexi bacterium]|nr:hypothetical protein [Chloroflexota bacterium]
MENEQYSEAANQTVLNLRSVLHSSALNELSELSLPEVEKVIKRVAQVVPAGNVPAMILSGLARLSGRKPTQNNVRRDVNLLFKGVEQALDRAVYGAVFAGPAAVIWGYQNMLRLVGKTPEDAFPEGTWQFYVDYALREDTARHANETHGFDTLLNRHDVRLEVVDRITAWVMTTIYCLHQYNALLENEWRERVYIHLLQEVVAGERDAAQYDRLFRAWEKQRPYGRGRDSSQDQTFPQYRRQVFDRFLQEAARNLGQDQRQQWNELIEVARRTDLPAYQRQMSILSYLEPETHGETRTPIALAHTHIGIIYQGRYYLIPACRPGSTVPADVHTVRTQVANILAVPPGERTSLESLAITRRSAVAGLRKKFSEELVGELDALRCAPVLLNFDLRPRYVPLSEVRQGERGFGDHALTVFDTGETFVFDQSHIFFDGARGAALAEILTREAIAWAVYLHSLPPAQPDGTPVYSPRLAISDHEHTLIAAAPRVTLEVSAESDGVDLAGIQRLRKLLQSRNKNIRLTVNDLLVLYRAVHAATYEPSPQLIDELQAQARRKGSRPAIKVALEALDMTREPQAAILIPVDASPRCPRERLHPLTFEVPLEELDLLTLHEDVMAALEDFRKSARNRTDLYLEFDALQRRYLAVLAWFGEFFRRVKEVAVTGETTSVGTIKLLAHLPTGVQRFLDSFPQRFDMLNDLIKGREVFSNVGAVAPSSSLIRFITAKDDNDKKTLGWGVITDADGIMRVSLRDFRPHVGMLTNVGRRDLAARITQDYLDAYVRGLNTWINDIQRMALASRGMKVDEKP